MRTPATPRTCPDCREASTGRCRFHRPAPALVTDDSRRCPACGAEALEFFVTLRRAVNPEANIIENRGPHRGRSFHVAADCQACGEIFEVKQ